MLGHFTHFFVQDDDSKKLLAGLIDEQTITVAGDTRFDRVAEIAEKPEPVNHVESFSKNHKVMVAGSTWPDDEKMLQALLKAINDPALRLIIAPHEIHGEHLSQIRGLFPTAIFYSELTGGAMQSSIADASVLVIDNIGLLSRLYKYAYISYIGGGFTKDGIHNSLEAAVYGKPVVFGPNYKKYREATELIEVEGAKSFSTIEELTQIMLTLINDNDDYVQKCAAAKNYVESNRGATGKIMSYIQENRLLTS